MKVITTSTIFVFLAVVASIVATVPTAFADHEKAEVSITEGAWQFGDPAPCEAAQNCFEPATVTIDVGGEVTWTNKDKGGTGIHTIFSGVLTDDDAGSQFQTNILQPGDQFKHKFDTPGEYPYFCSLHPFMKGMVIVQEAMAEGGEEIMVSIETGSAGEGEQMTIDVAFTDLDGNGVEHVNYDIMATQGTQVVLDEKGVHTHDGIGSHTTMALPTAASDAMPVDVTVTFQGFGIDPPFTGPVGQVAQKQVVPEFGAIAVMILGIAIVSIIAMSARSKIIPRI
ncbi:MAG TPA: plastocyanin/azurin family copper-binding protein [Nitrosopumilaceae archaeon]|nr:plastocyanin/azurin family copper-binding protein [Nitrosopumilaceae archaeon]